MTTGNPAGPHRKPFARSILRGLRPTLATLLICMTDTPVIADCEDARPIAYLAFTSDTLPPTGITDFADRVAASHLRQLPGVGGVVLYGDRRPVMRITVDGSRLAAYGSTMEEVEQSLRSIGFKLPALRARPDMIDLAVSLSDPLPPDVVADVVVAQAQGVPVRLTDVATIELAIGQGHTIVNYRGQETVAVGIVPDLRSGMLATWFALSRWLPTLRIMMPADLQVELVSPFSIIIERLPE